MLSNYMWNEGLSFHFATVAKRMRPEHAGRDGRPEHLASSPNARSPTSRAHPEIDVYVLGEGDFLAREVVRALPRRRPVDQARFGDARAAVVHLPPARRRAGAQRRCGSASSDIEDDPVAVADRHARRVLRRQAGADDRDQPRLPVHLHVLRAGRALVHEGPQLREDRMREEIEYIAERIKAHCPSMGTLRIADSNYGMFERDIEISGYIGEAQKALRLADVHRRHHRQEPAGAHHPVAREGERRAGALPGGAVARRDDAEEHQAPEHQASRPTSRSMIHMRGRGLRSLSDLILGLPGETLQTHLERHQQAARLRHERDAQLPGDDAEGLGAGDASSRATCSASTRASACCRRTTASTTARRCSTSTRSSSPPTRCRFDDYLRCPQVRADVQHLLEQLLVRGRRSASSQSFGVKPSEWVDADVRRHAARRRRRRRRWSRASSPRPKHELFPTREACVEFYSQPENFERLLRGEIGDNLMYKYRGSRLLPRGRTSAGWRWTPRASC